MSKESEEQAERDYRNFRSAIIAYHLGDAKKILDALDKIDEGEYAAELSDDEMSDYQPFSAEEASATIDMLRKFGVAVE